MRFITISGASGVGKTTLLKSWSVAHPEVPCFRFDAVGVPTGEMMREQYGSRENWQREMMFGWSNQPELCTPEMLDWQTYLVRQARKRSGVILIDTSSADRNKNLDLLSQALTQAMAR